MTLKPWDSLTELEKTEAIARRLGWVVRENKHSRWWEKPGDSANGWHLRDWPTNDGLAFTEVWPKIQNLRVALRYDQCPTVFRVYLHRGTIIGLNMLCEGSTWADAICRAAYELISETGVHENEGR